MSLLTQASLVITPNGYKEGTLYSVIPSDGSGDMSVVRATTATRVNSAGLVEIVANNIPRLDYSNGTCPSLLVEPQRTNTLFYSEQFDNAYWSKGNTSITVNAINSPSGILNADKLVENSANSNHIVETLLSTSVGQPYTTSIYFKKGERNFAFVGVYTNELKQVFVNLTTGVVTNTVGTILSSNVETLDNGWFRVSLTFTATASVYAFYGISDNGTNFTYQGDGTSGIYVWGSQLEAGSYATSYIPTTSASVTRNADVVSKTGISSLIGQTEGTIYWEGQVNGFGQYPQLFDLNANGNKFIQIFNSVVSGIPRIGIYVQNVGVLLIDGNIATISYDTNFKFALGYKANDYVVYLNGTQVYTNTTIGVPPTSNFGLGDAEQGGSTSKKNVKATALWKTRLTNTQLAQLTTI